MASFRIFERCGQIGAAQSSKKVALDAFAAQLTRLRQQLRDGSEAVVLQTFHELDGLTVGMYVYGYFSICMCVCVCVCVCVRACACVCVHVNACACECVRAC